MATASINKIVNGTALIFPRSAEFSHDTQSPLLLETYPVLQTLQNGPVCPWAHWDKTSEPPRHASSTGHIRIFIDVDDDLQNPGFRSMTFPPGQTAFEGQTSQLLLTDVYDEGGINNTVPNGQTSHSIPVNLSPAIQKR